MNKTTTSLFFSILFIFFNTFTQAQCHIDDWEALKALYDSTDGDNWTNRTGWEIVYNQPTYPASNCDLNALFGVKTTNGRVTCIDLDGEENCNWISNSGNNLKGNIPPKIGNLSELTYLCLSNNRLTGGLPKDLQHLNSLSILDLSNNNFSGSIPLEIGNLTNLGQLYLGNNNFNGTIPSQIGKLKNLNYLVLSGNNLSGNIPPEIGDLTNLIGLDLSQNTQLNGSIPKEIGNLVNLDGLNFFNNNLEGNIPEEISNLSKLKYFYVSNNNLSGEIPSSFANLINLKELSFANNNFEGNILDIIIHFSNLEAFEAYYNGFTGSIPSSINNLTQLKILDLNGNNFSGTLPAELGELDQLNKIILAGNQFEGCYPESISHFCDFPNFSNNEYISYGNSFDEPWEDFCAIQAGICPPLNPNMTVSTNHSNHSDNVSLILGNNQNILKNNIATIYDYSTCPNKSSLENCNPVNGLNNQSANEALWVVTKAAEYFSSKYNIDIPPVNILVNDMEEPDRASYNAQHNVIILGGGDNVKRKPMTAPDIVAHEYLHFLQHNLNNFFTHLNYEKESGALSESLADIFGEIIENYCYGENDWIFGKQVMTSGSGKQGIRSLSNPKDTNMETQTPDTYLEELWFEIEGNCDLIDRCGIHTNCGVQNHWFYKLANEHNGSIGLESAIELVFENYTNNLHANATYTDAAKGSIAVAKNEEEKRKIIEAWQEVGIYFNSTSWKLVPTSVELGNMFDEIKFDLVIDSLGEDISADGLNITLNLDESYQGITEEDIQIYDPLTENEVDIDIGTNEITFSINRASTNNQKRNNSIKKILSNTPVFGFDICIVVEDAGEEYCYKPVYISGHTEITINEHISFESDVLPLGISCIDPENGAPISNLLTMSLDITQKTCNSMGIIEVEVLDSIVQGISPYTFSLKKDNAVIEKITLNENIGIFKNLNEGCYILNVDDSQNGEATIEFEINATAETGGSLCCPDNLIVPPGEIKGSFNANSSIDFSNGSLILDGYFNVCEDK